MSLVCKGPNCPAGHPLTNAPDRTRHRYSKVLPEAKHYHCTAKSPVVESSLSPAGILNPPLLELHYQLLLCTSTSPLALPDGLVLLSPPPPPTLPTCVHHNPPPCLPDGQALLSPASLPHLGYRQQHPPTVAQPSAPCLSPAELLIPRLLQLHGKVLLSVGQHTHCRLRLAQLVVNVDQRLNSSRGRTYKLQLLVVKRLERCARGGGVRGHKEGEG
jgi:hypothetical protein